MNCEKVTRRDIKNLVLQVENFSFRDAIITYNYLRRNPKFAKETVIHYSFTLKTWSQQYTWNPHVFFCSFYTKFYIAKIVKFLSHRDNGKIDRISPSRYAKFKSWLIIILDNTEYIWFPVSFQVILVRFFTSSTTWAGKSNYQRFLREFDLLVSSLANSYEVCKLSNLIYPFFSNRSSYDLRILWNKKLLLLFLLYYLSFSHLSTSTLQDLLSKIR